MAEIVEALEDQDAPDVAPASTTPDAVAAPKSLRDADTDAPEIEEDFVGDVHEDTVSDTLEPTPEETAEEDVEQDEDDSDTHDDGDSAPSGLVASRAEDAERSTPSLGPATRMTSILGGKEPAIRRAPDRGREAGVDDDVLDRSFPTWAGDSGSQRSSGDDDVAPDAVGWLKGRQPNSAEDDAEAPPSWMRTDAPAPSDSDFEEDQEEAAWVKAPLAGVNLQSAGSAQPRYDELSTDEERFQIFGERGKADAAGWNRNLIVTLVLLLVLLVAGGFFGIRYLGNAPVPEIADISEPDVQPEAPEVVTESPAAAEPEAQIEEAPTVSEDTTAEPEAPTLVEDVATETPELASEPEIAVIDQTPEVAAETNPISAETVVVDQAIAPDFVQDSPLPESTELAARQADATPTLAEPTGDALPTTQQTPPQAPAIPQTEVAETIAPQSVILSEAPSAAVLPPARPASESPETPLLAEAETAPVDDTSAIAEAPELPADLLARSGSDWEGLSPEAREARYAATGIWPLAPPAPISPRSEALGQLYTTTNDPVVASSDAFAIATSAQLSSDKALTVQPNPPAAGVRFERDERGLILATIEGTLTPDGIIVYAGIPPALPPLAPRESPEAALAAQRAALQGLVPQLRPQVETPETTPETAADQTTDTGNRPPLRPPEIAALATAVALAAPDNPLALAETPVPRLRPTTMGQIVYSTERATIAAQTTTAVAPSTATAAAQATQEDAITLRGINLIGIYGEAGDRRALVRLQSGRYSKLEVGDRLNGGQVTAIDTDRLIYQRNGQPVVLRMPSPN